MTLIKDNEQRCHGDAELSGRAVDVHEEDAESMGKFVEGMEGTRRGSIYFANHV